MSGTENSVFSKDRQYFLHHSGCYWGTQQTNKKIMSFNDKYCAENEIEQCREWLGTKYKLGGQIRLTRWHLNRYFHGNKQSAIRLYPGSTCQASWKVLEQTSQRTERRLVWPEHRQQRSGRWGQNRTSDILIHCVCILFCLRWDVTEEFEAGVAWSASHF